MEGLLYCTMNFLCMALLFVVLKNIIRGTDKRVSQIMFACFVAASLVLCASDLLWGFMEYTDYWDYSPEISLAVNSAYHLLTVAVSYLWFLYSESKQESAVVNTAAGAMLSLMPVLALAILIITSGWTGFICYIDENGEYARGPLYILLFIVCVAYLISTSVKIFIKSFYKKHYLHKQEYRSLAAFCVLPVLAGFLQVLFIGSPMITAGIAFATMQVYINSRENLISVDPLTKLNNKIELLNYLDGKIKSKTGRKDFYLFIMDIDYFKRINDKYGHVEGDDAILTAANIIRYLSETNNYYACRYGGDEFVVVCDDIRGFSPEHLCEEINRRLSETCEEKGMEYTLHMSIGYTRYNKEMGDVSALISMADEKLYEIKNNRKKEE